tara:strand:+ start:204 stop:749 length:546 start_codon:yes stop_codon:yes gene_type:complete
MKKYIRKILNKISSFGFSIKSSNEGNRSAIITNFNYYLNDTQILKYVTEFHSTSYFTGHLVNPTNEEENYINYLKNSIKYMSEYYPENNFGIMWTGLDKQMLTNILNSDLRLFNNLGSLSYKTFAPVNPNYQECISEVIKTLCLYEHLSSAKNKFEMLHTDLNSGYLTKNKIRINSKLKLI